MRIRFALLAAVAVLIVVSLRGAGSHYYVSATGSDSANGLSPATAWQTVSKVNGFSFSPGDTISFHGGDSFTGPLTPALAGSVGLPITVNSYGTGQATISVGSGVVDGITLTNPQYVTVTNLAVAGAGFTGIGTNITVLNGGMGIHFISNATSGLQLAGDTISSNTVTGFFYGIHVDAGESASNIVGFTGLSISGNTMTANVSGGVIAHGFNSYSGGPQNQFTSLVVSGNTVQNSPGDPNSGTGGVHGSVKTDAGGIDVGNCTACSIQSNLITDVGGYGGALSGLSLGGSTAIVFSGSVNPTVFANEIARQGCSTHFDGNAIDIDDNVQGAEIAYNLTYNNVGPSIQLGALSASRKTTGARIHHNVSWNDVRGNNAGGVSEQGAFRMWGLTDNTAFFNNSAYVDWVGTVGVPSGMNFEGTNTNVKSLNNIFKVTGGIGVFWANETTAPSHIGTSFQALGNLYDSSGASLLISNDTGTAYSNITTLPTWRGLGYETLSGVNYGVAGAAQLRNLLGFNPGPNGFIGAGINPRSIGNFNLGTASGAISQGINTALVGVVLGTQDFHGNSASRGGLIDIGGVSFLPVPDSDVRGVGVLRGVTVLR